MVLLPTPNFHSLCEILEQLKQSRTIWSKNYFPPKCSDSDENRFLKVVFDPWSNGDTHDDQIQLLVWDFRTFIESVRICGAAFGGYPRLLPTYRGPWESDANNFTKTFKKSSPTYIMWKKSVRIDWWTRNQHSRSGTFRKSGLNTGGGSENSQKTAHKIEKST